MTTEPDNTSGVNPAGRFTELSDREFFDTIRRAVDVFGADSRRLLLFEEMAELQDAICKNIRGRVSVDAVCEEIADVIIVCLQIMSIYGAKNVEQWANRKMLRLRDRIEEKLKEQYHDEINE